MPNITINKTSTDIVENYTEQDLNLIPSFNIASSFNSNVDKVEFSIYNEQNVIEYINYNYIGYTTTQKGSINIDPTQDLIKQGFTQGNYTTIYNFVRNRISSSLENPFYIKEISSDRTELRIANNNISNEDLEILVNNFKVELEESPYFEDFEVNFGNNNIYLANNIITDPSTPDQYTVLIKLYEPLEKQFKEKDTLRIISQTAEEISYNVNFPAVVLPTPLPKQLRGPNFNLPKKGEVNNSTTFSDYNSLFNFSPSENFTGSLGELKNLLENKGITPNVNYADFNDFVYFSSAEKRVRNFYYKVSLIEDYNSFIVELQNLTNADNSGSVAEYQAKISNVLENFDEYENYQYYSSGSSNIYPKTSDSDEKPYVLFSTGSNEALAWLQDQAVNSGSVYDNENVDRLFNSLPSYIQDDNRNSSFFTFMDMTGQHFDNVWIYTKDLSNRFDADNRLKYGISKDIVADAIRSMGVNLYQNNFSSANLLSSLTGLNSEGGLIPDLPFPASEGDEVVLTYVTASSDPTIIDDVNKEFYKRIFHNLPLLLKQKGSVEGLRNLINTFGIPDTTLRISEFGGKDKTNFDDWDYYQNKFNYGLTGTNVNLTTTALNSAFDGGLNNISFRFKYINENIPSEGDVLLLSTIGGNSLNIEYTGGGFISASYSGSIPSASVYEGVASIGGAEITGSFFNGEWWTVGVENSKLRVGTKIYNGSDGFKTGLNTSEPATITYGNGMTLKGSDNNFAFQELRLYSKAATDNQFKDLIMNPLSIEGNSFNSSKNELAFRAPLGAELHIENNQLSTNYSSVHPAITGSSLITQSFANNSNYQFLGGDVTYINNSEFVYADQPAVGIKNRIKEKIRSEEIQLPFKGGNTLSSISSIQQNYLTNSSGSYTKDINLLEIAASPQNEINDDINNSFGYFNIGEYIGDPRQVSESINHYPDLDKLRDTYFNKYYKNYNWTDYVRLIKYFDNSLFKMIKDFAPAKSSLATGIVIKQHLLERNKQRPPITETTQSYYSGSIQTGFATGSQGGVYDAINYPPLSTELANGPSPQVIQTWEYEIQTISGSLIKTQSTHDEFYNGELSGSEFTVTNGELFNSIVKPLITSSFTQFRDNGNGLNNRIRTFTGDITSTLGGNVVILVDTNINKITNIALGGANTGGTGAGGSVIFDFRGYYDLLGVGDTLTFSIPGPPLYAAPALNFTITNKTVYENNSYNNYIFSVEHDWAPIGGWASLIENIAQNPPFGTNGGLVPWYGITQIYDGSPINLREIYSDPLLNNISNNRRSVIYQNVDYSNNASIPVNFDLLKNGVALKAEVQDSNYTRKSWSNSRYRGTRVSSLDFNLKIQR